jgi:hypothetical protein
MTERTVPVILDLSCRGIVMDYLFLKLYHIFAGSRNGGNPVSVSGFYLFLRSHSWYDVAGDTAGENFPVT